MARKLKIYVTSMSFYDLAVAAPSMKAAMEAWGVKHNMFHQGVAHETDDAAIVAAAMEQPGTVLRRPVGTKEPFRQDANLPAGFALPSVKPSASAAAKGRTKTKKEKSPGAEKKPAGDKTHRAAIISFEKARAGRERARAREEAQARRDAGRRASAVEKAEAALDEARKDHQARRERLSREFDRRLEEEDARWTRARRKLEAALDKARRS